MKVPGSSVFAVLCRMSRPGCDWRGTGGGSQMAGVVTTPPAQSPAGDHEHRSHIKILGHSTAYLPKWWSHKYIHKVLSKLMQATANQVYAH